MKNLIKTYTLNRESLGRIFAVVAAVCCFAAGPSAHAQTPQIYYWVGPNFGGPDAHKDSFVIAVDQGQADQIEGIFADGGRPGFGGRVAAGSVSYNKNYFAPGQPVWNWYVVAVEGIFDFRGHGFETCLCPIFIANPSDIAADPADWIQRNGDHYTPEYYEIKYRVDPSKADALANVSNRGVAGTGEKTLITGLIITGGEPRNVILRALGPSLLSRGVQGAASNPKLEVYSGSTHVATNTDWRLDARANELSRNYPVLAPENDREAAVLLTLQPGAYTLQGINEDGTEGVMLLEAYDVDAARQ